MRQEFTPALTKLDALTACPWAAVVIKVDGGYRCFESVDDAATWKAQR